MIGEFFRVAHASRHRGPFFYHTYTAKVCFGETPKVRAGLALHARRVRYQIH
jgi:hypothetical protein